jgi:hypothetical protein
MSQENIICGICQDNVVEPVMMSCEAMHKFCFRCILEYILVKNKIDSCPCCRNGGGNIIIPTQSQQSQSSNFLTIGCFKQNLVLIEKIIKKPCKGSCIISDSILFFYVKNKKNIQMYNTLRANPDYVEDSDNELLERFNWNLVSKQMDYRNLFNYATEFAGPSSGSSFTEIDPLFVFDMFTNLGNFGNNSSRANR